MNKLALLVVAVSFVGVPAAAQAMEQCPATGKIKEISGGVYRANSEDGEWLGILQGLIPERTPVRSFERALAIQENLKSPLYFQYCSYQLGTDKTLDMRFIPSEEQPTETKSDTRKSFTIETKGDVWKKEEGPFGLIYDVCETVDPEKCQFSVIFLKPTSAN
ncbi:DUF3757 domain-containing protein [Phyllobacterium salinisoli]|uniref:DUF3757 domain-containing protein n=1 Tax=Phyllobacterium salinisoli TaxID=1899321 RepID=A0A368JVZ2_9HYPH|nr:DUF3757 domain-containing protein [Phyllobacterium salinisoli]RCS21317.1 DUF3757 domain-containing protein [Phyllobacterium salinisoli]